MTSPLPPMGGHAPPERCGRLLEWPDESSQCPNPATTHVIWTEDMENGLECDEHAAEARSKWVFWAMHPYRLDCSMPGARFIEAENRCVVDEGLLGLQVVAAVELGV